MKKEIKKHKRSRQEEAISYYRKGFSQTEIAEIIGVNQSTVSRYFNNPTSSEVEDFYENYAYGARVLKSGQKVPFNRRYRDLEDATYTNEDVERTEWYYNDGTFWPERFHNSINREPAYDSEKSWEEYIAKQKIERRKKRKFWKWT
jgi:transcriptional regulator with XRE-family HTH domain